MTGGVGDEAADELSEGEVSADLREEEEEEEEEEVEREQESQIREATHPPFMCLMDQTSCQMLLTLMKL